MLFTCRLQHCLLAYFMSLLKKHKELNLEGNFSPIERILLDGREN